jgi:hypothetical protein
MMISVQDGVFYLQIKDQKQENESMMLIWRPLSTLGGVNCQFHAIFGR